MKIDYEKSMPDLILLVYNKTNSSDMKKVFEMEGTSADADAVATNGTKIFTCCFDAVSLNANACLIGFKNPKEDEDEYRLFNVRYDLP